MNVVGRLRSQTMKISSDLFDAFLKCPTKCYLRSTGQAGSGNAYAEWVREQNDANRAEATKRLVAGLQEAEVAVAPRTAEDLKAAKWRLVLDLPVQAGEMESRIHAVERVPSERRKPDQFIPIRFVFFNKLTKDDRLLAAFDALVLSEMVGQEVSVGKIIHGDDHATLKVKMPGLVGEADKLIGKITALLAGNSPPALILNRHCGKCKFREGCRQKALEQDDLSLLTGMSAKDRQMLRCKGIFTVAQLSYTFRPRRRPKRLRDRREKYHHALKALAIRQKKIHIIGIPELKIEGTPVYLDVEGLPDRDFYYLIGLCVGSGESAVRHNLWADTVEDEGKFWREFLGILEIIEKPVLLHYGSYETGFLRCMCRRYGVPAKPNTGMAIKHSVNLLSVIFAQVYFPTFSNGLKDIAGSFGFKWTVADSSGLRAIVWRHQFESGQDTSAKARLLAYNAEDCLALKQVTERLQLLTISTSSNSNSVVAVDDLIGSDDWGRWGERKFASEDFRLMADCAYFDYQRSKIYIHSNAEVKRANRRKRIRTDVRNRPNKIVVLRSRRCWRCKTTEIVYDPNRWHRKLQLDLRISAGGIKRWITEFRTPFHRCLRCESPFFPSNYKSKKRFGHDLIAWVVHQHITNRLSFHELEVTLKECFGIRLPLPEVHELKHLAARYYQRTYKQIIKNLVTGGLIHADETKMVTVQVVMREGVAGQNS